MWCYVSFISSHSAWRGSEPLEVVLPVYRMTSVLAHNENTAGRFSEALGRNSFSLSSQAYSSCYKHILPEERYKLQTVSWCGVFRVDKSLVAISTVTTTS